MGMCVVVPGLKAAGLRDPREAFWDLRDDAFTDMQAEDADPIWCSAGLNSSHQSPWTEENLPQGLKPCRFYQGSSGTAKQAAEKDPNSSELLE
jgi:hypothetical protein